LILQSLVVTKIADPEQRISAQTGDDKNETQDKGVDEVLVVFFHSTIPR